MSEKKVSFIGLPSSGKTTFLAALWYYINSQENECDLTLDGYKKNYQHLNSIQEQWVEGNPVNRTPLDSNQSAILNLKSNSSGEQFILSIPDLSGEEFEQQIANSKLRKEVFESINDSCGLMLFISANKSDRDIYFHEIDNLPYLSTDNAELSSWDYHLIPTQVKLVQLLQSIICFPFTKKYHKLAIMISAWDIALKRGVSPEKWLEQEYPMLHQFLNSNTDVFSSKIYGVSAQGGDLNDSSVKEKLISMFEASERIICADNTSCSNDITQPLAWIIRKND